MAVFLVTPLASNLDQIGEVVKRQFVQEDRMELQGRAGWLVSHHGTSVDVSHLLGLTSPDPEFKPVLGSAMVTTVNSYYGRGPTTMWEWLKAKLENPR